SPSLRGGTGIFRALSPVFSLLLTPLRAHPGLRIHEYLYFQVLSPGDIRYIFTATPAKDFGGVVSCRLRLPQSLPPDHCNSPELAPVLSTGEHWEVPATRLSHPALLDPALTTPRSSSSSCFVVSVPLELLPRACSFFILPRYMIRRSLEQHGLPWAVISIPVNVTSIPTYEMMQPPWTFW
ncbi:PADC1 protein, partial [Todus mexicanus]|nr:PADC1 protein [Todus mexicanus]